MSQPKVAICHQTVAAGDAIGEDICGMYRLLQRMGWEPIVVCESYQRPEDGMRWISPVALASEGPQILIYHHSQLWSEGENLVEGTTCPILFRYHNITPAWFFARYSTRYEMLCEEGRAQTLRFQKTQIRHLWLADSNYNLEDLVSSGGDRSRIRVAPPFNLLAKLFMEGRVANYASDTIELLFVGRFAPNKGHAHLLRTVHSLAALARHRVVLRIMGARDPELSLYDDEITALIDEFGLRDQIVIHPHSSHEEWLRSFRSAHAYLCFSEHEGFCVPIAEAQAIGLPIIGSDATAVGETAGTGQLISSPPVKEEDYQFYALLVEQLMSDPVLRSQLITKGEHNVRERFADEVIENAFTGALYELLQG